MTAIYKMMYRDVGSREEFAVRFNDYVHDTDYGTFEVMTDDVRNMEDDLQSGLALTSDETNPYITQDEVDDFKYTIGEEVYDMLLDGRLDIILLV